MKFDLKSYIRDVPDFPKKGIIFKDITTLIKVPEVFSYVMEELYNKFNDKKVETVVGVEARGFIFAAPIACKFGVPFAPIRKKGKLPWQTEEVTYDLEYGQDTVAIHRDAFQKGTNVLLIDDLLATGGTIKACCQLIELLGGKVVGCGFVIELGFLKGRERLKNYDVVTLVNYEKE